MFLAIFDFRKPFRSEFFNFSFALSAGKQIVSRKFYVKVKEITEQTDSVRSKALEKIKKNIFCEKKNNTNFVIDSHTRVAFV